MAVNPSYRAFVLDQLGRVAPSIRDRSMFGGVGIYSGDLFFGLIAGDTLFLKVDDANRADFEAADMGPFMPFGEGGEVMQYYELPPDVLEEPDRLTPWVEKAIDVARRARMAKRSGPAKSTAKATGGKKPGRKKPAAKPKKTPRDRG
jgi:TfoX/Sxy family transcriptional regulator of competence genes